MPESRSSVEMTITAFSSTAPDYPHRDVTVRLANEAEGNIYIYIDGVEYGSLFIQQGPDDDCVVTLGQYSPAEGQWIDDNNLGPVQS